MRDSSCSRDSDRVEVQVIHRGDKPRLTETQARLSARAAAQLWPTKRNIGTVSHNFNLDSTHQAGQNFASEELILH